MLVRNAGRQPGAAKGKRLRFAHAAQSTICPENAWDEFLTMLRAGKGLDLLLAPLPPGSTRADALGFHRKVAQLSRRPSSFLDAELGIERR